MRKENNSGSGVSLKSKAAKVKDNNLEFPNSPIKFTSCSVDKDILNVYLLYNNQKVQSVDSNVPNFYRIITREIGVKNDFQELTFIIVNNIQLSINIKFINKFSTARASIKDRLAMFNKNTQTSGEKKFHSSIYPKKNKTVVEVKKKDVEIKNEVKKEKSEEKKEEKEGKKEDQKIEESKAVKDDNNNSNQESKSTEIPKNIDNTKKTETEEKDKIQPLSKSENQFELKRAYTEPIKDDKLRRMTYMNYLKEQNNKGIKHPYHETFCEGFFIASFPQKDGKVIEMSESFPAQCKHKECSELPSMKPEILFRYPLTDTKNLELNNLAATICFPTGIKVCYDENNGPGYIKDYVTSITNQKGERYYMMTYHFYLKLEIDEFQQYEQYPLKYVLQKFTGAFTDYSEEQLTDEIVNAIQEKLEFCQNLGLRDVVYVPFCICLISKYPYVNEMKCCLQSIYNILNEPKEKSDKIIYDSIMYLINSIPIPQKNMQIKFPIPYFNNCLKIDCPKLADINIMNCSVTTLLSIFSVDNLILIFRLLITEKKILIIDEDYERLSRVSDGFVSILYPFQWIHTYIPIMSDQMLKYLETFLPFLNGINISLMNLVEDVFKNGELSEDDEVFLIYVTEEKDKIKLSSLLKGKKKKLDKYVNDNIPPLPSSLEKDLRNKLKKLKYEAENKTKKKEADINLELQIRDTFVDFFVEIFHDYSNYLSFIDDDTIFNKSLFIEKKKADKKFYDEILDTQLFQQFTQNIINDDLEYFNNKITLREEKNSRAKSKDSLKDIKVYDIYPDFLKDSKDEYKEVEKKTKDKNPVRILENTIVLDDKKYDDNECIIYLTPQVIEETKEKEEDKKKKEVKIKANKAILEKIKMMNLNVSKGAKNKNELSEKEQENIKETIKDYVVKIFRSEEINLEAKEKNDLFNKLNIPFGRNFFITLLSKNSSNVILLKENSFHLLWSLINECIVSTLKLSETKSILENIVNLIKSTKYFGTTENGATLTMFQKYRTIKIKSIPKVRQENFWQSWYDVDLKKKNNPTDGDKQEIIYEICKTLIELEMPKSMIKKLTDSINIAIFGKGTEMQKKTFDVFIKFIVNAKYVSPQSI